MWSGVPNLAKKKAERRVSTRPLSGIGVGRIESYAEMRSDATRSRVSSSMA